MPETREKKTGLFYPLLALLLIFSAALRIYRLGLASYWVDEMVSLHFAHNSQLKAIFWDNSPFLYNGLLKLWVGVGGMSEVWTRMLSVLISVGTTALLYNFGFYLGGLTGALAFGLLHALCPLSINYAQETRMYALFEFAMCLQMIFFIKLRKEKTGTQKLTLATCLLCLSHYLAIIPLAIESGFLLLNKGLSQAAKKKVALALGGGLVILAISAKIFFGWSFLEWQKLRFEVDPQARWPWEIFWNLINRSWITGSAILALVVYAVYARAKKINLPAESSFFILVVIVSLVLFQAASLITKRGIFLSRYFIFLTPFFISWVGLVWLSMWRGSLSEKRASVLILAVFAVGSVIALPQVYVSPKAPWREASKIIGSYPQDLVLTTKSVSIQTPYFEAEKVPVERWRPDIQGNETIQEKLKSFKNVWILENYWGTMQYLTDIKGALKDTTLAVTDLSIKNETSEPLLILRIQKAAP